MSDMTPCDNAWMQQHVTILCDKMDTLLKDLDEYEYERIVCLFNEELDAAYCHGFHVCKDQYHDYLKKLL